MESSDDNRQPPCSPCPAHFERSADGFSCEFSGHFELADEPNGTEKLHFDLSALRESGPLTARVGLAWHLIEERVYYWLKGIRVFSRDGQSYQHQFNFSLFPGHWVRCRDSMAESASSVGGGQPAQAQVGFRRTFSCLSNINSPAGGSGCGTFLPFGRHSPATAK
jgi:hypothetical protein